MTNIKIRQTVGSNDQCISMFYAISCEDIRRYPIYSLTNVFIYVLQLFFILKNEHRISKPLTVKAKSPVVIPLNIR